MNIKNIMFASALVLITAVIVTGCGGSQPGTGTAETPKMIQTYGEAELSAPPELAKISLAIETRSRTAVEAVEENARLASAVRDALLNYGLAEEDMVTGSYRLYSYREWLESRPDEEGVQTFQSVNEIIVTTTRIEAAGDIIDIAVGAGANNINFISYELEDPQELLMQALKAATEQAARKAEAIADGTGEKITGPYSIREERADYIPYKLQDDMLRGEMAMGDTATPITPDTVTVRAAVVAEFTFR